MVSMATSQPKAPAHKLRWFQYSLRSLMLLVLLVSLGMSWVAVRMKRTRQEDEAVEEIRKLGGYALYDYQFSHSGNPFDPPGPTWLRHLLGENFFAAVVEVNLTSSSLTDAGLEHLKGLTQLRTLNLIGTPVTDAGLEHLKGLTQLEELDLCGTEVTDTSMEYLKGLRQLRTLCLFGRPITDAGLVRLMGLARLQTLDLRGTWVTVEGVKRLQQALPKCEIRR
jgi:hypothetical protein